MIRLLMGMLVVGGLVVPPVAGALAADSPPGDPVIVVTGTGAVEARPDRVMVEFTVVTRAKSAAAASTASAAETKPIVAALSALGVPDSAITSAGFAVQPKWDHRRGSRNEGTKESTASHRIRVRVREVELAGAIAECVLDNGADRIELVTFSVSNLDRSREEALTQAVGQARSDAAAMAKAAGGELGRLIEVTTQGTAAPPRTHYAYAELRSGVVHSSSSPPSITPGPTTVTVTVLGRWAFAAAK